MCNQFKSLPRSYVPFRPIMSFNNAIGCCVPYSSTAGMCKSSMKHKRRLPIGGPTVSFVCLSMTSMMELCTSLAVVLELKFIVIELVFPFALPLM